MEDMKVVKRKKHKRIDKYKQRKIIFWFLFLFVLIFGLICLLKYREAEPEHYIRVAICGAVKSPAVYTLKDGADMSMLVRAARGFNAIADIGKVDMDKIVLNDSVYHIPVKTFDSNLAAYNFKLVSEYNKTVNQTYTQVTKQIEPEYDNKEIKKYTILYVGLPAVYVLINYYPDFNRINFIHIPHSAVFLNNDYRLIDIFFTMDIYPTMRIIEHSLKQKIDFYLIQDRSQFIDLINILGGVSVNLDEPYATAYNLNSGWSVIDGFHAWEYIRFMDWRNIPKKVQSDKNKDLIREDNFKVDPRTWERIYEMRNQRQRYVLLGMRHAFVGLRRNDQLEVINHFKDVFQTDMKVDLLMSLYKDILSTKNFGFGSLPGYYQSEGQRLFFYPDLPNFEMLQKAEIRKMLSRDTDKTQTIY